MGTRYNGNQIKRCTRTIPRVWRKNERTLEVAMIKIAGIDKDFSAAEIAFHTATEGEKLNLSAGYIAAAAAASGRVQILTELDDGTKVKIEAKIIRKRK